MPTAHRLSDHVGVHSVMRANPTILTLIGLISSIVILGSITFVYSLVTFDLAGGETVRTVVFQRLILLSTFVFVAFWAWSLRSSASDSRIHFTNGLCPVPTFSVVYLSVFCLVNYGICERFNSEDWGRYNEKPFRMAYTIVTHDTFDGLAKDKTLDLLGECNEDKYPNVNPDRRSISYHVMGGWILRIYFSDGIVADTSLKKPGMMN